MEAFTVLEKECVQIDQRANAVRNAVCDATDDAAAVRVAAQHHVRQFLPTNQVDDVADVRVEVYVPR